MTAGLALALGLAGAVLVATIALERDGGGVKEAALIATLAAAAAAGRVLFAPLPSVQPVTVICLVAGATLGLRAGVAVGMLAPLISNGFLGHGPWTPAQMVLWGLAGAAGAALGDRARVTALLVAVAALLGVLFSWGMNAWFLASFGPQLNLAAFVAASLRSLPFDLAHATGNAVIAALAGPALVRLLIRYRRRIRTSVGRPDPAPDRSAAAAGDRGSPGGRTAW
jgi:energy-coupling factor transport system substrate-specific component